MKQITFFFKVILVIAILQISQSSFVTPKAYFGLDSYAVFLNDKLLIRQAVNVPLTLESLQLSKANSSDKLIVHYSQCNAENRIGKNRSLVMRDSRGQVVKQWKFVDVASGQSVMTIPVNDLLQLDKSLAASNLSLYYVAEGRSEGQKLIHLQVKI